MSSVYCNLRRLLVPLLLHHLFFKDHCWVKEIIVILYMFFNIVFVSPILRRVFINYRLLTPLWEGFSGSSNKIKSHIWVNVCIHNAIHWSTSLCSFFCGSETTYISDPQSIVMSQKDEVIPSTVLVSFLHSQILVFLLLSYL